MNLKKKNFSLVLAAAALILVPGPARALIVPFVEEFNAGPANWKNGANIAPAWSPWGGVADSGFIATQATINTNGFGPIIFRGNNANDASGDAFVGNWLAGGVTLFTTYVRHDAPVSLSFYVRLDAGAGNAASSNPIEVAPNQWTLLTIPIVNSLGPAGVFQSYGAAGTNFALIFGSIQNVQIALSAGQNPVTVGQTYNVGLDRPTIVPEPSLSLLLLSSAVALGGFRLWRRRQT